MEGSDNEIRLLFQGAWPWERREIIQQVLRAEFMFKKRFCFIKRSGRLNCVYGLSLKDRKGERN